MQEVLLAHEQALIFGGRVGVRDIGSIEAAIARPYCGYYRAISQKAAALLHSLATNHGFIDGNKRTALYMTTLLLARSGYKLRDDDEDLLNKDVEEMVLAVVERRMTFDELVVWFKARIVKPGFLARWWRRPGFGSTGRNSQTKVWKRFGRE